jgi:hypothetical protein
LSRWATVALSKRNLLRNCYLLFRMEYCVSLGISFLFSEPQNRYSSDIGIQKMLNSVMKFRVFWDIAPCSHVEVDRCFRGAYGLHRPWSPWWWQYAPLKRRSTSTWLHGATSYKTLNFTLSAVRTWHLTNSVMLKICAAWWLKPETSRRLDLWVKCVLTASCVQTDRKPNYFPCTGHTTVSGRRLRLHFIFLWLFQIVNMHEYASPDLGLNNSAYPVHSAPTGFMLHPTSVDCFPQTSTKWYV